MEVVLANLSGKTRRERIHGREYIVAPLSMIVHGVLHGSQGALYYPLEEISRDPMAWNGVPIVLYHPLRNGKHVSARDPDILEQQGIGHVYRSQISGEKLGSEGWFDVEATRRLAPVVLQRLEKEEPLELSTGLFTENIPGQGTFNGVTYDAVARNYRPDHLAVLPDEVGACSIKDGCGVLVNDKDNKPSAQADVSQDKACKILKDGEVNGKALTDKQKGMFGAICGKEHTRNADGTEILCDLCSPYEQGTVFTIAANKDYLLLAKLHSAIVMPGTEGWIEDAKDGVVIYKQNGKTYKHNYTLEGETIKLANYAPVEVRLVDGYYRKLKASDPAKVDSSNGTDAGKESKPTENTHKEDAHMNRDQLIAWLTTNCDCWKGKDDKEVLNKIGDDKLKALKAGAEKAKQDADSVLATNQRIKELKESVANAKGGNPMDKLTSLVKWIKAAPEEMQSVLVDKIMEVVMPGMDTASVTDTSGTAAADTGGAPVTMQSGKPNKQASITERLSPEELAVWNNAVEITSREKRALVERILSVNVGNNAEARKRLQPIYERMGLPELRAIVESLPARAQVVPANNGNGGINDGNGQQRHTNPLFIGAGGTPPAPVGNVGNGNGSGTGSDSEDDALDLPVANWSAWVEEDRKRAVR